MRNLFGAIAVIMAGAVLAAPLAAEADVEVDFRYFHERLAPHGTWVEVETHGWVWYPDEVATDWRPYTRGHWVHNESHGWVWASGHDWGWATTHYGRWTRNDDRWVWVPGTEWSGAWVAWRHGEGHIGWAALPPAAKWEPDTGVQSGETDLELELRDEAWVFVPESRFSSKNIDVSTVPGKAKSLWNETRFLGTVTLKDGRPFNGGLDLETAERIATDVSKVKLKATKTLGASRVAGDEEGTIRVFMPRVKDGKVEAPREINKKVGLRKTHEERQRAEMDLMRERHMREARDNDDPDMRDRHRKERDDMRDRHRKENDEFEKMHGKDDAEKDRPGRDRKRDGSGSDDGRSGDGRGMGEGSK